MAERSTAVADAPLPKKSLTVEFWVGIFTILGTLAFAYLSVNVAGMKIYRSGIYRVNAEFNNVAGLKVGAPVEIAGVAVGEVEDIKLSDTSAMVTLAINNGVPLRDDDICAIRTKGIIGDRYIKIVTGSSSNLVKNNSKFTDTESAMEFEEIIGKLIHRME